MIDFVALGSQTTNFGDRLPDDLDQRVGGTARRIGRDDRGQLGGARTPAFGLTCALEHARALPTSGRAHRVHWRSFGARRPPVAVLNARRIEGLARGGRDRLIDAGQTTAGDVLVANFPDSRRRSAVVYDGRAFARCSCETGPVAAKNPRRYCSLCLTAMFSTLAPDS
jgi:hypothetical protein